MLSLKIVTSRSTVFIPNATESDALAYMRMYANGRKAKVYVRKGGGWILLPL